MNPSASDCGAQLIAYDHDGSGRAWTRSRNGGSGKLVGSGQAPWKCGRQSTGRVGTVWLGVCWALPQTLGSYVCAMKRIVSLEVALWVSTAYSCSTGRRGRVLVLERACGRTTPVRHNSGCACRLYYGGLGKAKLPGGLKQMWHSAGAWMPTRPAETGGGGDDSDCLAADSWTGDTQRSAGCSSAIGANAGMSRMSEVSRLALAEEGMSTTRKCARLAGPDPQAGGQW